MPEVFADTFYWIALLNPADNWHQDARRIGQARPEFSLDTTEAVLTEMLNYFSGSGEKMREAAVALFDQAMTHANTVVLPRPERCSSAALSCIKLDQTKAIA